MRKPCECADPGCPVHIHTRCTRDGSNDKGSEVLRRLDMIDETGTYFCGPCASDALESGLYSTDEDLNEQENDNA